MQTGWPPFISGKTYVSQNAGIPRECAMEILAGKQDNKRPPDSINTLNPQTKNKLENYLSAEGLEAFEVKKDEVAAERTITTLMADYNIYDFGLNRNRPNYSGSWDKIEEKFTAFDEENDQQSYAASARIYSLRKLIFILAEHTNGVRKITVNETEEGFHLEDHVYTKFNHQWAPIQSCSGDQPWTSDQQKPSKDFLRSLPTIIELPHNILYTIKKENPKSSRNLDQIIESLNKSENVVFNDEEIVRFKLFTNEYEISNDLSPVGQHNLDRSILSYFRKKTNNYPHYSKFFTTDYTYTFEYHPNMIFMFCRDQSSQDHVFIFNIKDEGTKIEYNDFLEYLNGQIASSKTISVEDMFRIPNTQYLTRFPDLTKYVHEKIRSLFPGEDFEYIHCEKIDFIGKELLSVSLYNGKDKSNRPITFENLVAKESRPTEPV